MRATKAQERPNRVSYRVSYGNLGGGGPLFCSRILCFSMVFEDRQKFRKVGKVGQHERNMSPTWGQHSVMWGST